jgi:protocatechuate 3,4-dioxygenase beta subunit
MNHYTPKFTRRQFFAGMTFGALSLPMLKLFKEELLRFFEEGHFADELVRTPSQTEGPFYPHKLPLDTDNDLLIIGKGNQALGEITHLTGRILDRKGQPVKGTIIEIWQVDSNGVYIHSGSQNTNKLDKNFQGYGKFETALDGAYRFRTIKPVPYPGRTPHIHVKAKKQNRELLTTQCYIKGHPMNAHDGILQGIRDPKQRESVIVAFEPMKNSRIGELSANFDIILGYTPAE